MAENTVKENRTLEELFQELDGMMRQMEEPGLSLEQSFSLYHRGIELLQSCNDKIDTVEKQIQILEEDGECHEF
ncbi:MAG: exodeoxyribonuclease VII small subunit [Lachnospiraceae bacterium]|nr:exodeoxyribonuclease VII small subunit [Lachnospiraceae bacterium]